MLLSNYSAPKHGAPAFTCPHCGIRCAHDWGLNLVVRADAGLGARTGGGMRGGMGGALLGNPLPGLSVSHCQSCGKFALWVAQNLVYPDPIAEPPIPGLPDKVHSLYLEAASISCKSPRASAGLFRLCLEKLLDELGIKQGNLHHRLKMLQELDINHRALQAADLIRCLGNKAMHGGEIDFDESPDAPVLLAQLINYVALNFLTLPAQIEKLHKAIPEDKRAIKHKIQEPQEGGPTPTP